MKYTKTARPTEYNGARFRSRLEARWAAFFDICGWRWDYEPPTDFCGWLPDFVLYSTEQTSRVYVEVKPITSLCAETTQKIDQSGCSDEVLLLGETTPVSARDPGSWGSMLGWLREKDDEGYDWDDAMFTVAHSQPGFCHYLQSWHDRMSGTTGAGRMPGCADDLAHMWREAGNRTQWMPPK